MSLSNTRQRARDELRMHAFRRMCLTLNPGLLNMRVLQTTLYVSELS